MHQVILKKILAGLQERTEKMSWPFPFGSKESILAAAAVSCGMEREQFLSLTRGKTATARELEEILHGTRCSKYEKLREKLLSWSRSIPLPEKSCHLIRSSLQTVVHHREIQDIIMLLGFGEPVFPVSESLRHVLFSYHLFDSSDTYPDIQDCIEKSLATLREMTDCFLSVKYLDFCSDEQKKDLLRELKKKVPLTCSNCGQDITRIRQPCIADIRMFPSRNLFITEEDLRRDFEKEWRETLESARQYSADQMEKQVYAHYRLILCEGCRERLDKKITYGEIV